MIVSNLATESDKRVSATTPRHACDLTQSVIIENGRTLRIDYRNLHHVNVHSLERCQQLCSDASSIKCATFAYNHKTADCLLSLTRIDKNNRLMLVTQPNPNFDLYSFLGTDACSYNESDSTTPMPSKHSTLSEFTATMFLSDPFDEESKPSSTLSTHPTLASFVVPTASRLHEPKLEPIFDIVDQPKQTTRQLPVFTTPHQITRRPFLEKSTTLMVETPTPLDSVITATSQVLPHRDKTMERLPTNKIHVTAMCLERGVNVTFKIDNNYTGAIYAAERFSQCRIFVESRNEFNIFVTRPSVNNFCNALEEDGELTAVLVMSNDMVLPYDVTHAGCKL